MKKYVIVERNEDHKRCLVLNEETTSLKEIWWTMVPYNIKKKDLKEVKPKLFDTKSSAEIYKKVLQSQSNADWKENSHIHKMWGKQKQKWSIEEHKGSLIC